MTARQNVLPPPPERSFKLRLRAGFTLVEIAIALVIIGLIIGGILVGADLIRAAGNRAFVAQLESYNTSVLAFTLKYGALPGDISTATTYGLTSNGNGNGAITGVYNWSKYLDYESGEDSPGQAPFAYYASTPSEVTSFWTHLS